MTSREGRGEKGIEFLVLGPLEVRVGDEPLPLGGAKQRAVLAVLLLHADESVSVERLIDEVWGDGPPPSAAHSLEAYVSRLRQLLSGRGPLLVRRGAGYVLELRDAGLDSQRFEALVSEADLARDAGDFARVACLSDEAGSLWRGPALSEIPLAAAGRAAAERLEEMRLRVFELRFEAELALGRHQAVVGELQTLVAHNPYRERFVEQLMLALYRSGRQADALDLYEQTRRRLDDDLGLQPSAELRELSGQIVRQEPQLLRPKLHGGEPHGHEQPGHEQPGHPRVRRAAALVVAASVTAAVMAFTASGSGPERDMPAAAASLGPEEQVGQLRPLPRRVGEEPLMSGASSVEATRRVALVLPSSPEVSLDQARVRESSNAFRGYVAARGLPGDVVVAGEGDGTQAEHVASLLEDGSYALAIVVGDTTSRALAPLVRRSATRFVFVDASLAALSLAGARNATGMPFADPETSHLMGFLGATVPLHVDRPASRADAVAIVVSRETPRAERLVHAFRRGVRRGAPGVAARVAYVTDETDKTACERLANDLIDAGSDVIYAVAGECSPSVLATVKLRGAWGMRANDDAYAYGPHILATTYKRWDLAVGSALNGFALGTLPRGRDVVLGLADDYAVDAWGSGVPAAHAVWSKVTRLCTSIRERTADDAP